MARYVLLNHNLLKNLLAEVINTIINVKIVYHTNRSTKSQYTKNLLERNT